MTVELNLLISILKLTVNKPALFEDIKNDGRVPQSSLLTLMKRWQSENLVKLNGAYVEVESNARLELAARAISLGADVEVISNFLRWQEFECIAATALENFGYAVQKNVHFKQGARRWEIDVVGCRKPLVICIDCKSWHHSLSPSSIRRVVEAQVMRTRALADAMPNADICLKCATWDAAKFVPVVIVLMQGRFKFCDEVPIVPILQLRDFLSQMPLELESLKYFVKDFAHLGNNSNQ